MNLFERIDTVEYLVLKAVFEYHTPAQHSHANIHGVRNDCTSTSQARWGNSTSVSISTIYLYPTQTGSCINFSGLGKQANTRIEF